MMTTAQQIQQEQQETQAVWISVYLVLDMPSIVHQ